MFKLYQVTGAADNPMASEMSGHIGGNGNFFCRKCHAGGCTLDKETNATYHSLFLVCLLCVYSTSGYVHEMLILS